MTFTREQYEALVKEFREEMKNDGFPDGNAPANGWIFSNWVTNKLLLLRYDCKTLYLNLKKRNDRVEEIMKSISADHQWIETIAGTMV